MNEIILPNGWMSTALENVCEVVAGNPARIIRRDIEIISRYGRLAPAVKLEAGPEVVE